LRLRPLRCPQSVSNSRLGTARRRDLGAQELTVEVAAKSVGYTARSQSYNAREGALSERRPFSLSSSKEPVMPAQSDSPRQSIIDDFANVIAEAETLLKAAATETGEKARDLRSQVESKLLTAKLRLQELQGEAVDRAKEAARVTDDYVHDHPWQAIGIAAAVGLAAGLLINRR